MPFFGMKGENLKGENTMTAMLFDIENHKLKRTVVLNHRKGFQMKNELTGTDGFLRRREPAAGLAGSQTQTKTNREQHNTPALPPITFRKSARRLIAEGTYRAVCSGATCVWYWGRWDVTVPFAVDDGPPIPRHASLGTDREHPEIIQNGWLGRLLTKGFGIDYATVEVDLSILEGEKFIVEIGTCKCDRDGVERPKSEWYSVVRKVRRAR
jgi:hypothetical protein